MIDQPQHLNNSTQQNAHLGQHPSITPTSTQFQQQLPPGRHSPNPGINDTCRWSYNQGLHQTQSISIYGKMGTFANLNTHDRANTIDGNGHNQATQHFWKKLRMIKKNYICNFCTIGTTKYPTIQTSTTRPMALIVNKTYKKQYTIYKDWLISSLHNRIHSKSRYKNLNYQASSLSGGLESFQRCLNTTVNDQYYRCESQDEEHVNRGYKSKNNRINIVMERNRYRSHSRKPNLQLKYYPLNSAMNQLKTLIHYYRFILYIPLVPSCTNEAYNVDAPWRWIPQIFNIVENYHNIKKALTYTTIKLQLIMQNNDKIQEQSRFRNKKQQVNKISSKNSSKNKISSKSNSKIKNISKKNPKAKNKPKQTGKDKNPIQTHSHKKTPTKSKFTIHKTKEQQKQQYEQQQMGDEQQQQYSHQIQIQSYPIPSDKYGSSVSGDSVIDSLEDKLEDQYEFVQQEIDGNFVPQHQPEQQSLLISRMDSKNSQQSVKQLITFIQSHHKRNGVKQMKVKNSTQKPTPTSFPQIIYQSEKTTPNPPIPKLVVHTISNNKLLVPNRFKSPTRNDKYLLSCNTENNSLSHTNANLKSKNKIINKINSKNGNKNKDANKDKEKNKCRNSQMQQANKEKVKIKQKYHEYFQQQQISRSRKNTKINPNTNTNKITKTSNKKASRGSLTKSQKNNKSHSQINNQLNMLSRTVSKQQLSKMNKNNGYNIKYENKNQNKKKVNKNKRVHNSCGNLDSHTKNCSHIVSTKCVDKNKYLQDVQRSKDKSKYKEKLGFFTDVKVDSNQKSKRALNSKGKKSKKNKDKKNQSQKSSQQLGKLPTNLKVTDFKDIITKLKHKIKCDKVQFDSRNSQFNRNSQTLIDGRQQKNDIMNNLNTIKLKQQSNKRMKTLAHSQHTPPEKQHSLLKPTLTKEIYHDHTDRLLKYQNNKVDEYSGQITKKQEQKTYILQQYNNKNTKSKQKKNKDNIITKDMAKTKIIKKNKQTSKQKQIQKQALIEIQKQHKKHSKKLLKQKIHQQCEQNKILFPQNERKSSIKVVNSKKKISVTKPGCNKQKIKSKLSHKKSRREVYQTISTEF